jgi:hypothetical protein
MIGPPTGDFHPIYNAPMLGAHNQMHRMQKAAAFFTIIGLSFFFAFA